MPVRHDADEKEFVIDLDDARAYLSYRSEEDGVINLVHTEVPEEHEGKGLGSQLARAAIEYAKENDLKVRASCPFVRSWLERHPEYSSLVAR